MSFPWNDDSNSRQPSGSGKRVAPQGGGCPWAQDDDASQFQRGAPSNRGRRTKQEMEYAQPPMPMPQARTNRNGGGGGGGGGAPWASDDSGRFDIPTNAIGAGIGGGYSKPQMGGGMPQGRGMPPQAMPPQMGYPPQMGGGMEPGMGNQEMDDEEYYQQKMYEQQQQQQMYAQQQQQQMYAQPLPDDGYDMDYRDENRPVQVPMPAAGGRAKPSPGGAPWAQDNSEPMMSVAQASYGGQQPRQAYGRKGASGEPEAFDAGAYAQATQQSRVAAKVVRDRMMGAGNVLTWG